MTSVSPQCLSHFLGTHLKVLIIFSQKVCDSFSFFAWIPFCLCLYRYLFHILENNYYLFARYLFIFIQNIELCLLGTISNLLLWHIVVSVEVGVWCLVVWTHPYFLVYTLISLPLYISCLISRIDHTSKEPHSLSWKMVLENNIYFPSGLIVLEWCFFQVLV